MASSQISSEEKGVLAALDRMDAEGRAGKADISASWDMLLKQFRGDQWKQGNPFFLANIIGPVIDRKVALLTESKPTLYIGPRRKGLTQTAQVLKQCIDAGWDAHSMEQVLQDVGYNSEIFGAGFIKLGFDPSLPGGGDIVPMSLDPRAVRCDPAVQKSYQLDTAQFVIVDSIEPLWQFWRQFPGRGQLVAADPRISSIPEDKGQGGGFFSAALSRMQRTFRFGASTASGAVPRAGKREYWFHDPTMTDDGKLKYPFGRHIIRGGTDVVLLDEPNPYWDGTWDVDMLDGRPDPDHPWGRSQIEALRRIQEAFNRIGHLFVENTILTGNTWIEADHDALETDAVNMLKDIGAIIITKKFGRSVTRTPPPMMPPHFLEFLRLALQLVDIISGLSEPTMQGKGRVELRSGAQLEGLQSVAQTLIRQQARRLETFLERVGQKWISRVFQFYTSDRMMLFLGKGSKYQTFEFERALLVHEIVESARKDATHNGIFDLPDYTEKLKIRLREAWRDFHFKVTPGSSLAATKMQRASMSAELARNGMLSREHVLEELGYPNPKELIEQALEEAQILGVPAQQTPKRAGGGKKPQGIGG